MGIYNDITTWCDKHHIKTYHKKSNYDVKQKFNCNSYMYVRISKTTKMNIYYDDVTSCFICSVMTENVGKSKYNYVCEFNYIPYVLGFIDYVKFLEV